MRSYIFTKRERRIIARFLEGKIDIKDRPLSVILARFKGFVQLSSDVDLYLRLRETIATKPA